MKPNARLILALVFGFGAGAGALAADGGHEHGTHDKPMASTMPAASANAAWVAAAKAAYPLDTCVVSGDKLEGGDMGEAIDYVYKVDGQPDRLLRFCCKDCIRDFTKDPAEYLAKLDAAAAEKAATKKTAGTTKVHSGHSH